MAKDNGAKRLPNSFFKMNPLMEYSAAMLAHFTITAGKSGKINQMIYDVAAEVFDETRRDEISQDRQRIEQTDNPGELVEVMRSWHDIMNRGLLCSKILEFHEQAMPLILRKYRTCALKEYTQMLREMYRNIRCPFTQASACFVFVMQGMEDELSFLVSEYESLQREYPDETFDQHPFWRCIFYMRSTCIPAKIMGTNF